MSAARAEFFVFICIERAPTRGSLVTMIRRDEPGAYKGELFMHGSVKSEVPMACGWFL